MVLPFRFPRSPISELRVWKRRRTERGRVLRLIQNPVNVEPFVAEPYASVEYFLCRASPDTRQITSLEQFSQAAVSAPLTGIRVRHKRFRRSLLFQEFLRTILGAGLCNSSCARTFCRPAVSASICFCCPA